MRHGSDSRLGNRAWRTQAGSALALAAVSLGYGCSALVDPATKQCDTDADCEAKGGGFSGAICTPEKVCTLPHCTTHAECDGRFGAGVAGYCRPDPAGGLCTRLFTPDCERLVPADGLMGEHLLVGFMAILKGGNAAYGLPHLQGTELALNELNAFGGIPSPGLPSRRLVMLVCDHGNPANTAQHLFNNLRVPAILGPSFSGVAQEVLKVAEVREGLVFSGAATSPALPSFDGKGLFWRTVPSDNLQTEVLKRLVPMIEETLRMQGVLAEGARARIAMPFKGDDAGRSLFNAATTPNGSLTNPAPPLVMSNGFTVNSFEYLDPNREENRDRVPWDDHVQSVIAGAPHIIIPLGTDEFVNDMLEKIEERWPMATPRPWYLLPEGNKVPALLDKARASGRNLAARVIGTAPGARSSERWSGFSQRFQTYSKAQGQPGNLAEFTYDAAYLLAYAVAISNQPAPSGRQLSAALGHVSCIERPPVLPNSLQTQMLLRDAARDGCINFEGVSGPLDFNTNREAPSDYAIWCLRAGATTFEPPLSTYYSYERGELVTPAGLAQLDLKQTGWCPPN